MKFELLADSIKQINDKASSAAKSAVNQLMTLRNWVIGYYIVEYEQDGSDRAQYGSHLLKNLEKEINQKGMNYTLFKTCRQFYKVYPQIGSTVSTEFELSDFEKVRRCRTDLQRIRTCWLIICHFRIFGRLWC